MILKSTNPVSEVANRFRALLQFFTMSQLLIGFRSFLDQTSSSLQNNQSLQSALRSLKRIRLHILLLTVLFVILCVLLIIPVATLFFVRSLLNTYIRYFRPDLVYLIAGTSNMCTLDDPHCDPVMIVGPYQVIEGDLDVDQFVEKFEMNLKRSPFYDQMKWCLSTFCGFSVWKRVENFNIRDQVMVIRPNVLVQKRYQDRPMTETEIAQFAHEHCKKPFPLDSPPWDLTICKGVKVEGAHGPCTIIFSRAHHVMGDGFSLYKICCHMHDNPDLIDEVVKIFERLNHANGTVKSKTPLWKTVVRKSVVPFVGVYQSVEKLVGALDFNAWHKPGGPLRKSFNYCNLHVRKRDVAVVRNNNGNISFVSVLLGIHTAALRRYFAKHGLPVPKSMHYAFPVPVPRDLNRLDNSFTEVNVTLPTGLNSRSGILQTINEEQTFLKNSLVPFISLAAIECTAGLLPTFLLRKLSWRVTTGVVSNVPGLDTVAHINGLEVLRQGSALTIVSTMGVNMWCLGYRGDVDINVAISKDICQTKEAAEELVELMREEMRILVLDNHDDLIL